MTKKELQRQENARVEEAMGNAFTQYVTPKFVTEQTLTHGRQLCSMQAKVERFGAFTALVSYRTLVAIIDSDGNGFDFLRKVYGYTNSSAKQIRRFFDNYGARTVSTWRKA